MAKFTLTVFFLADCQGNIKTITASDGEQDISTGGYDEAGVYRGFDSEAWHLEGWAEQYGFKVERIDKEVQIETTLEPLYRYKGFQFLPHSLYLSGYQICDKDGKPVDKEAYWSVPDAIAAADKLRAAEPKTITEAIA